MQEAQDCSGSTLVRKRSMQETRADSHGFETKKTICRYYFNKAN
jgi:hypothetical protein